VPEVDHRADDGEVGGLGRHHLHEALVDLEIDSRLKRLSELERHRS
jgi:hypothetical protein